MRDRLLGSDLTDTLVRWLSEQVERLAKDRERLRHELDFLQKRRQEVLDESGLTDIQGQVKKVLQGFEGLTRVQQRLLLGKVIDRIVIRSDNHLEIRLVGSGAVTATTRRNQKLDSNQNGGFV
ncbi:MAG: hypothetical protein AB7N80_14770 [Bdellovibrionales bacterium]